MKDNVITAALIENAYSYKTYKNLIQDLYDNNRVTGDFMDNNETILGYTKMNISRMRRIEKTFKINSDLEELISSISKESIWLIITEGWCGDASQIIPTIFKMGEVNKNIEVKFVLRDENPELMDQYLTNGSRSIPILILLDKNSLKEIGRWGPRPAVPQQMTMDYKANDDQSYDEYTVELHKWYAKNKYQAIQEEIFKLVEDSYH